jgi:hypothetical protein
MTDRQIAPQQSGIAVSLQGAIWRKSSFSGTQGNCVEVSTGSAGVVAVRDSKHSLGSVLVVGAEEWRALVANICEHYFR